MAEHPNLARIGNALAPQAEAVFGNIGMTGSGRSGDAAAAPLRRVPLYAQAEKVLEDLLVHRRYRVGDRIPPEVELVRSLGVSRAPSGLGWGGWSTADC